MMIALLILCGLLFIGLIALGIWYKSNYKHRRGNKAESKVRQVLQTLPKDEYILLNDLMLPTSYGTTQIDHVVLSTHGIYVIETKNYSGTLTGNEKSEQWEQNINGFRYKTGNALRQNRSHIAAVRFHGYISKETPVHNIVVFARATDFDIHHETGEVIYIDELLPTIQRLRSDEPILTLEQVSAKANNLRKRNITDKKLREEHNKAARAAKYERRAKIEQAICPRCGGELILRHGQYSDFYGCSNYPKCDFTVKDLRTNYDDYNERRKRHYRRY